MLLNQETVVHTLHVTIDGKGYRVVKRTDANYQQQFGQEQPPTINWSVFASRGQWGERYCDPDKPVYKRVVEKAQSYLAELEARQSQPVAATQVPT